MAGLDLTDEQRKAEVLALVRELRAYEARAASTEGDEAERWKAKVAAVREQLDARGAGAKKPQERATKRGPKSVDKESR